MIDDNMPYRRIIEPEPYYQPPIQQYVPSTKESQMIKSENVPAMVTVNGRLTEETSITDNVCDNFLTVKEAAEQCFLPPWLLEMEMKLIGYYQDKVSGECLIHYDDLYEWMQSERYADVSGMVHRHERVNPPTLDLGDYDVLSEGSQFKLKVEQASSSLPPDTVVEHNGEFHEVVYVDPLRSFSEPMWAEGLQDCPGVGYPLELVTKILPIRADIAEGFVEHYAEDDKFIGRYFPEFWLNLLLKPKYTFMLDALNFYFLPLNPEIYAAITSIMEDITKFDMNKGYDKLLPELKQVISLFPELEERMGLTYTNNNGPLKVPEVARMLSISESKVRKLVAEGSIEYTKSQGETGHYRFTRSAVREYVKSR